jgi:hypothetical protein
VGTEGLDPKQAEAAAKLEALMGKLHDAQSRLDAMIAESRRLQERLRRSAEAGSGTGNDAGEG